MSTRISPLRRFSRELANPIMRWAYIFMLPGIIYYLVFYFYPTIRTIILSFHIWKGSQFEPVYNGIANFQFILKDPTIIGSIFNTFYFVLLTVPMGTAAALVFAVLLTSIRNNALRSFFRAVYFIPTVTGVVIISIIWMWCYQAEIGLFNFVLLSLGLGKVPWLVDKRFALPSIAVMSIWRTLGFNIVIFLAGLAAIPQELYEAATVDGAKEIRKLLKITLPLIAPITWFVFINSTIGSLQAFSEIWLMTQGGPGNSSMTMGFEIYDRAFRIHDFGLASAAAILLMVLVLIITLVQMRFMRQSNIEY